MLALSILTAAAWTRTISTPDLLLGDRSSEKASVIRAAKHFGNVEGVGKDGFVRLKLKAGVSTKEAEKGLKRRGVRFVLPGSSASVDMESVPSLHAHTAYLKALHELQKKREKREAREDEDEAGGEFYESLEWFIRLRSGKSGKIDKRMYQDVGPKNVSTPYTIYMSQGPVSGRKNGLAYAPSDSNVIYIASAGGGVWKSVNGGTSYFPLTDNWPFLNTTSVAVHPTDPKVVLVGTGDYYGNFSTNSFGIMKSTDGGATWKNVGDSGMRGACISKIIIEPTNPNIVVCTCGKSGANDSQIHRSVDGGNTWSPVPTSPLGNWDSMDRSTGGIYYASGTLPGTSGGLYKSTDKGATWTAITNPADPATAQAAIDICCSKVNANIVYLLLPTEQKVYRSTNAGTAWVEITGNFPNGSAQDPNYNWSQGSYDHHINCAKDGTTDLLFVGLITVAMSRGGGASWVDVGRAFAPALPNNIHSDQHSFAMNPALPTQCLFGCDGGLYEFTLTPGKTTGVWQARNSTFSDFLVYEMAVSNAGVQYLQCGCQDNFSPSSRGNFGAWTGVAAGDGAWAGYQPSGENFATNQNGGIFLFKTLTAATSSYIRTTDKAFVSGFFAPYVYAENPPKIYGGGNTLWRYTGTGQTWTNFGVDITPYQPQPGELLNLVTELETAKSAPSVVYSGSTNGEVFLIKNNGTQYRQIDNLHIDRSVGAIDTSWTNPYDVMVGLMGDRNGNPRLWRCTNTQATTPIWTSVSGVGAAGLPDAPINSIKRDPYNANTWYVATDVGCFMTTNAGVLWTSMASLGLPNVLSETLVVSPDKKWLFVGTFGRGIYRAPLLATATVFSATGHLATVAGAKVVGNPVQLLKSKTVTVAVKTTPNTPIPDGDPNGVYIPIAITANGVVRNVSVSFSITHYAPNELVIWLVGPNGTYTEIWSSQLPVAPNLSLTIPITFFNGIASRGNWQLFVRDSMPFLAGTVNTYNLQVQYDSYVQVGLMNSDVNGNYAFANLDAGEYRLVPQNKGKSFTPASKTFSLGPNLVANFTRAN